MSTNLKMIKKIKTKKRTKDKQAKAFLEKKFKISKFSYENSTINNQMPILKGDSFIPEKMVSYKKKKMCTVKDCIHFFHYDYQIECIWNNTSKFIETCKNVGCVLTPDFSALLDMPMPVIHYNVYRSRLIGQILQKAGIKVIPTVIWAGVKSYDVCFEGLPKNSVLAISTIGTQQKKDSYKCFVRGFKEMVERLNPSLVLVYGKLPGDLYLSMGRKMPKIKSFKSHSYDWTKKNKEVV